MGTFIHHLFRALSGNVQEWTKQNIPAECSVLHDFGDGAGPVPAAPVDRASVENEVIRINVISHFAQDNSAISNDVIGINIISHYAQDNASISNDVIGVEELI